MKKAIALLLALTFIFALTACGGSGNTDGEAIKGSETVTLVMPEMFFTGETEEEIIAAAKEEGFRTAEVNEDGTVTVTLTKAEQDKLVREYEDEIESSISDMLKNKDEEESLTGVEHSKDYSSFEIKVDKDKYKEEDDLYTFEFAFLGAWRQILAGTAYDKADTVVKIVDDATGEELHSESYRDWMDLLGGFGDLFGEDGDSELGDGFGSLLEGDFDLGEWENELEQESEAETPEMEEQVLLDHDGVLVKAVGIENGYYGTELKVYIENNSDKAVNVSSDAFLINDYVFSSWFSENVAAGKKCNSTISISSSDLKASGQEAIGKIGIIPYLYDDENYERIYTGELVEFETSDYAKIVEDVPGRTGLYSGGGVSISLSGYSYDPWWGETNVELCVENDSGHLLSVNVDDIAVNGYMISDWGYKTIPDGKKSIVNVSLSESALEENGIDVIEEVDFEISGTDSDTWDDVFNAGRITVTKAQLDACSR